MNDLPELPHDIDSPEPWLPGVFVPWWVWLAGAVVLVALVALLVFLARRRRSAAPPDLPSLYAKFSRQLEALAGELGGRSLAEVATAASLVLRGYLAGALSEPALFETHEETLARADSLQALPQGARDRLAPLLNRLAEYKYGPSRTEPGLASDLIANCREVLQGIHSTLPRTIA